VFTINHIATPANGNVARYDDSIYTHDDITKHLSTPTTSTLPIWNYADMGYGFQRVQDQRPLRLSHEFRTCSQLHTTSCTNANTLVSIGANWIDNTNKKLKLLPRRYVADVGSVADDE
jgi:hypothetical protein